MRRNRPQHSELTEQQRQKANARSYANVYLKRGWLTRLGCEVCGKTAQMHHEDYSQPLQVRWLCRSHHLAEHDSLAKREVFVAA